VERIASPAPSTRKTIGSRKARKGRKSRNYPNKQYFHFQAPAWKWFFYESFSDWEADAQKYFGDPRFGAWFERMIPLVESGRREFYTLVE